MMALEVTPKQCELYDRHLLAQANSVAALLCEVSGQPALHLSMWAFAVSAVTLRGFYQPAMY